MTLPRTLELVAAGAALAAGGDLQLPQSDPAVRHRAASSATRRASASRACCSPTFPSGSDPAIEQQVQRSPLDLIRLVAPTTRPERLARSVAGAQGFLYLVSRLGVTGASATLATDLEASIARVRAASPLPIAVGFGISTAEQAARVGRLADGVVVGSALVDRLAPDGVARGARPALEPARRGRPDGGGGMSQSLNRVIDVYARFLAIGGIALAAAVLLTDQRFINAPISSLVADRVGHLPARLPGPPQQVLLPHAGGGAGAGGRPGGGPVVGGARAAGGRDRRRHDLAPQVAAGGPHQRGPRDHRLHLRLRGLRRGACRRAAARGCRSTSCPAGFSLVAMYFLASRALFYFTLLVRDKLEQVEQLLILRWEVVSMLLSLGACVVVIAALQSLSPAGWVAVAGVLTAHRHADQADPRGGDRRRGPEQDPPHGVGDHRELPGCTGPSSRSSGWRYRLLDWGDYRICRWNGAEVTLAYRGRIGRPNRERLIPELADVPPRGGRHGAAR